MLIARVATGAGPRHGIVHGDRVELVHGLTDLRRTGEQVPFAPHTLLAPVLPGTIYGMAHNSGPGDRELAPQAFLKPRHGAIGPGDPIPVPHGIGPVVAEAELALVIGSPARHRSLADALEVVLGYTAVNDVTARALQAQDSLWLAGKGFDGFTPLGPVIDTELPIEAGIRLAVDGTTVSQSATTALARGFAEIIVYLSSITTLQPGDVILTGAPGADAELLPGGRVAVTVGGLTLVNPVVGAAAPVGLLEHYRKAIA
ncbi:MULTISPECIES: fumarylacetoacetate hydrolase family protein [unclassified Cryobacterium]|uniref:fumarylacetoacetate hydrolase family protein n=1 Tax=unclassified Cryobacterium TaxID=2649013 RepID=UPI00106C4F2C|nr:MULTISPECIES: fumarylacetoacetate hydrolase family protein [unclassified Cryobacterium]TFC53669.1 FAA hydrolase family protein [Cryobacterium sp. TMB3-1-2]TFC58996.1 FAA hydrolase family protein [Cryobacterium sp. TMB1-7]TFC75088.1 FAA hydrolase family protein [Cryobacterium sp. TMB3-15]TFC75224.1 FAA hydrolase family protein [Cryobacterium sp. TMB3-10]TFD41501.1 FAA hydrolase family protein [Cryobacterium sp. TMB3-12]